MSDKKTVIALGYFDSVHKGHIAVIERAKAEAERLSATPSVFSFDGNLKGLLFGGKCVFTAGERAEILKEKGIENFFFAPVDSGFLSLSPLDFLEFINGKSDIIEYVAGEDYRFGRGGAGDVNFLKSFAKSRNQSVFVCPKVCDGGEKISTSRIKELLSAGKVKAANGLLSVDYFITGEVKPDRKIGRTLGFPTVNIKVDENKCELKNGVYAGYSVVGGVKYTAIINYGSRPTFGLNEKLVEAHLIGFTGSLYGKTVRLSFTRFLRDIKTFHSEEELKEQLKKDAFNAVNGEDL